MSLLSRPRCHHGNSSSSRRLLGTCLASLRPCNHGSNISRSNQPRPPGNQHKSSMPHGCKMLEVGLGVEPLPPGSNSSLQPASRRPSSLLTKSFPLPLLPRGTSLLRWSPAHLRERTFRNWSTTPRTFLARARKWNRSRRPSEKNCPLSPATVAGQRDPRSRRAKERPRRRSPCSPERCRRSSTTTSLESPSWGGPLWRTSFREETWRFLSIITGPYLGPPGGHIWDPLIFFRRTPTGGRLVPLKVHLAPRCHPLQICRLPFRTLTFLLALWLHLCLFTSTATAL